MSEMNDQPEHALDDSIQHDAGELSDGEHELSHALEEMQRMVMMQGVTINSLQQRIFSLNMEIVDLMSMTASRPPESQMESPE